MSSKVSTAQEKNLVKRQSKRNEGFNALQGRKTKKIPNKIKKNFFRFFQERKKCCGSLKPKILVAKNQFFLGLPFPVFGV